MRVMLSLYKSLVRPHVEYCLYNSVYWTPPFNSHTLSFPFLNKNFSSGWGMERGLAPSPFNFIKIKQHALKNIKYENKL